MKQIWLPQVTSVMGTALIFYFWAFVYFYQVIWQVTFPVYQRAGIGDTIAQQHYLERVVLNGLEDFDLALICWSHI